MREPIVPQSWGMKAGFVIATATLAGLTWWASHSLNAVIACLMIASPFPAMYDAISAFRRRAPAWKLSSFRFSIWQVMAITVAVAGYLALVRALFDAYPIEDQMSVLIISGGLFVIYATFCVLVCMIWVAAWRLRAVLRDDRIPRRVHGIEIRRKKGEIDAGK